jgi:predicted pyridoxine 5'-phosphate oxidase superfamily flavin-nucleotide-binding protein
VKAVEDPETPFHAGERAVQERAGTRERAETSGRGAFRDHMPEPHRELFARLPFIVVAALDHDGQPWASLLAGPPGFISAPTPQRLQIAAQARAGDPLAGLLTVGRRVGLLGIEQHTRRRNRMNGIVAAASETDLTVDVSQSFGNCPKYIQARVARYVGWPTVVAPCRESDGLDAAARNLIAAADTFFIATAHPAANGADDTSQGVDVSHRGGRPGFVRVEDDGRLTVPDFVGNGFFNTLGNLQLLPRAGLLFADFAGGSLLHVAVDAEVVWDAEQVQVVAGAKRLLRLHPRRLLYREAALPLRWGPATLSPVLPE